MSLYLDPTLKIPVDKAEEQWNDLVTMGFYIGYKAGCENPWVLHDPKGRYVRTAKTREQLMESLEKILQ